jgi:inner membrane protein
MIKLNTQTPLIIAAKIWLFTGCYFGISLFFIELFSNVSLSFYIVPIATIIALIGSLPILIAMWVCLAFVSKIIDFKVLCFLLIVPYSILGGNMPILNEFLLGNHFTPNFKIGIELQCIIIQLWLFGCFLLATYTIHQQINFHFSLIKKTKIMTQDNQFETPRNPFLEEENVVAQHNKNSTSSSNKILVKGIITALIVLAMLVPTVFVSNIITEREQRQKYVVQEVSSKWSSEQTLTGPYLYIPYVVKEKGDNNKEIDVTKKLIILPENLDVVGNLQSEIRPRSIYKVLLYKSNLASKGDFVIKIPKEIDVNTIVFSEAKICFGLSDFRGIEEKVNIKFNGLVYELSPGLPTTDLCVINNNFDAKYSETRAATKSESETVGLSSNINLSAADFDKSISFTMQLKIKGSERLHFLPLSGNSSFALTSNCANPSFDGNNLPNEREVTPQGFKAKWTFNKANLPFSTTLKSVNFKKEAYTFGVTLVQPADQYAKTMRCVKYAILFIALTFAFFFIIELMQKKAVHPVQYVLVGLALVIFFILLLSISEFLLFNIAYLIAAIATVLLITIYIHSHFKKATTSLLFMSVLSSLYGFIFVLISLEDTALLVGSIGLFIILAVIMYASRKINWYGEAK